MNRLGTIRYYDLIRNDHADFSGTYKECMEYLAKYGKSISVYQFYYYCKQGKDVGGYLIKPIGLRTKNPRSPKSLAFESEFKKEKWYDVDYETMRNRIPPYSGVYVLYSYNTETGEKKLLYIGKSVKLRARLSSHPMARKFYAHQETNCRLCIKFKVTEAFNELEFALIKRIKPPLNIVGVIPQNLYRGLVHE